MSSLTIMQVAVSSVNRGSKANPSLVKKSMDRFRSLTGRLTKILVAPPSRRSWPMRGCTSGRSSTGRISKGPPRRTPGCFDMSSTACSMSRASSTRRPPRCSLDSMNGPSVTSTLPRSHRSVLAVRALLSASPATK